MIQLRYMGLTKFWMATVALIAVCVPVWKHFGSDAALPVLADCTPILLAIVGVVMSYIQPKKENHRATTVILIVAGILGSAGLSANRIHSEGEHRKEVIALGGKIDNVRTQNENLANVLIAAKGNGGISETDRRRGIETTLRNEYVLSHDPIDPDILAGTKSPPQDWMKKRLLELGETWTIAAGTAPQMQTPRSYLVLDGNPRFTGPNAGGTEGGDFVPGSQIAFNIHYKNSGPNALELGEQAMAAYLRDDIKPETEGKLVGEFTDEVEREKKMFGRPKSKALNVHTMGAGTAEFFTANAWSQDLQRILFTQDDLDKLKTGEKVAYVMADVSYKDLGVQHHFRVCMWLQKPASSSGIWHFCSVLNNSN